MRPFLITNLASLYMLAKNYLMDTAKYFDNCVLELVEIWLRIFKLYLLQLFQFYTIICLAAQHMLVLFSVSKPEKSMYVLICQCKLERKGN